VEPAGNDADAPRGRDTAADATAPRCVAPRRSGRVATTRTVWSTGAPRRRGPSAHRRDWCRVIGVKRPLSGRDAGSCHVLRTSHPSRMALPGWRKHVVSALLASPPPPACALACTHAGCSSGGRVTGSGIWPSTYQIMFETPDRILLAVIYTGPKHD